MSVPISNAQRPATSISNAENNECMREIAIDRRKTSWRTFVGSLVHRRRAVRRRDVDGDNPHYVDIHEPYLFFVAVAALVLCVADAFFTLTLINFFGSTELNPVMDYFIKRDIQYFFIVKFSLTAAGIMFLVIHKNFKLFNRISGYQILHGCLIGYALLVSYELFMLLVIPAIHFFS